MKNTIKMYRVLTLSGICEIKEIKVSRTTECTIWIVEKNHWGDAYENRYKRTTKYETFWDTREEASAFAITRLKSNITKLENSINKSKEQLKTIEEF